MWFNDRFLSLIAESNNKILLNHIEFKDGRF